MTAGTGPCLAVWRDRGDRALVACADDALPAHDWCGWHLDRRNGPTLLLDRDRSAAARTERPPISAPPRR